ncbi:AI-2E family transporter [Congregibacter variabilis]|uniref:AI-2E family transporter n=1 Tax=Congregibacter variabilis TaxID=3081200 RepID=A0ABZ0I2Q0_9GAMM|nr:AI-2E family transporter [Congregibacter sp. IMCC43200]
MSVDINAAKKFLSRDFMDFCIRLGLIVVVVVACERIFAPFLPIMLWGVILAVSLYPLFLSLCRRTGFSPGHTATLMVVLGILLLGVPTVMLGSSFATHIFDVVGNFDVSAATVSAPDASVKDWPVVGERVFDAWSFAHTDLPGFVESLQPQLGNFSKSALKAAASTAGTLLFFFGALIIAGVMMAYGESGTAAMGRIFRRMVGEQKGSVMHTITTLTVRSVATGVVGVAFIQALLLGVGFMMAGIPAAGLLALVVLVIGILQLPALLVSLPAIAFVWGMGDGGTVVNVALTVYFVVAGIADNVLKPMLLGRGVSVPMPVVLLGALGGMMGAGIVGLFVGAVILSVGYELFMGWVDEDALTAAMSEGDAAGTSQGAAD